MAALTGRTNAKHIQVFLDQADGTLVNITAYVNTVGTIGLTNETQDTTAYSDGSKNVTIGQPSAPLSIGGPFDTTINTLMTGLVGANGHLTSGNGLSLDIRVGIRAAVESDSPQFGITGSASIGYQLTGYSVNASNMTWAATLEPYGPTAPAWGSAYET
jgi:hypothetical protein